jgi:hypothetical protein
MNSRIFLLLAGAVALVAPHMAGTAYAQGSPERTVEQYACKDVMRESGSNREVAIAFLHGFLLGKSGSSKFNIELLQKQTDAFVDRCLDNPNERAMDAMTKVK